MLRVPRKRPRSASSTGTPSKEIRARRRGSIGTALNPFQGISPGWVDQYHQSLEGQKLDITSAEPGRYYLVSTANYAGTYLEANYTNNTAWQAFDLTRDSSGNPKIALAGHSPCETPGLCGIGAPNR
jgi:hypothetical protein